MEIFQGKMYWNQNYRGVIALGEISWGAIVQGVITQVGIIQG